jgi:hypothetical protein
LEHIAHDSKSVAHFRCYASPPLTGRYAPIEDIKLQVLNDHYKDTFSQTREYIKIRDKLLVFILLTVALTLLQIYSPKEFSDALSKFVAKKIESNSFSDLSFVGTIVWFLLLGLSLRYFQTVLLIEKQYEYLHELEEYIRKNFIISVFAREGRHYLKDYPLLSDFAHIIYTRIFPMLLILIGFVKIYQELASFKERAFITFIDFIIFITLLALILLYMFPNYSRK